MCDHLCIYYDCPSKVNNSNGNVTSAFNTFKNFDLIVFADVLTDPAHSDHTNTITLITMLKNNNPAIKIFGYIDVGVFAVGQPWIHNYSEVQLKQHIDNWKLMGVNGVFGDDFGFDYAVTRPRQNVFIDYAHSKGLSVFANSWQIEDALGGNDCHLDSAYKSRCKIFLTNDKDDILTYKLKLKELLGLRIFCIAELDECLGYILSINISSYRK